MDKKTPAVGHGRFDAYPNAIAELRSRLSNGRGDEMEKPKNALRRGDIVLYKTPTPMDGPPGSNERFAVVIGNQEDIDDGRCMLKLVLVIFGPLNPDAPQNPCFVPIAIDYEPGMKAYMDCYAVKDVYRERVSERVGHCTDKEMKKLDEGLCYVLGIESIYEEKTYLQQVIADNEAMIANLQNELNALQVEDTDLRTKLAEQSHALEMQRKELEQAQPCPTTEIDKTELAVLRAERDIYKSVADRLLDK